MGEKIIYLLLVLLPVQLGKHFWFDFSFVSGIKIDYLSPTLYLTDLLILLTIGFWFVSQPRELLKQLKATPFLLMTFLLVNLLSVTYASNKGAAFLGLLKLSEFFLLALFIKNNFYKLNLKTAFYSVLLGSVWVSLLAWGQFLRGGDLGLWLLGERDFSSQTPGIAQALMDGRLVLRPYGTFPHPNVLGGYLAVVITLLNFFNWEKFKSHRLYLLGLFLSLTLLLTFSRTAALAAIMGTLLLLVNFRKKLLWPGLIILTLLTLGLSTFFLGRFQEDSWEKRAALNSSAVAMIKERPILGVGANNFIPQSQNFFNEPQEIRLLQPVHNLFLLLGAEIGWLGLLIFISLVLTILAKLVYSKRYLLLIIWLEVLLISLFDHYFWTLQQGQIILWSLIGISLTPMGVPAAIRGRRRLESS